MHELRFNPDSVSIYIRVWKLPGVISAKHWTPTVVMKLKLIEVECRIYASVNWPFWFRQWLVAWSAPRHYLNQGWNTVAPLGTNFAENLILYSNIFIKEKAFENVVRKLAAILSRPQCVDSVVTVSTADRRYDILWVTSDNKVASYRPSAFVEWRCTAFKLHERQTQHFHLTRSYLMITSTNNDALLLQYDWRTNVLIIYEPAATRIGVSLIQTRKSRK